MSVQSGHDRGWLSEMLSRQAMLSNLVGILAGLATKYLVDTVMAGHVAPYDLAVCLLAIGGVIVELTWHEENHDDAISKRTLKAKVGDAVACIRRSRKVLLLGGLQVCFSACSQ
jgi:MFS transporter, MFS domain-containing protein family, molybdate-anion transporter